MFIGTYYTEAQTLEQHGSWQLLCHSVVKLVLRWRCADAAMVVDVPSSTCCVRWYPAAGALSIGVFVSQRAGVMRLSREPAAAADHVICVHVVLKVVAVDAKVVHRFAADCKASASNKRNINANLENHKHSDRAKLRQDNL